MSDLFKLDEYVFLTHRDKYGLIKYTKAKITMVGDEYIKIDVSKDVKFYPHENSGTVWASNGVSGSHVIVKIDDENIALKRESARLIAGNEAIAEMKEKIDEVFVRNFDHSYTFSDDHLKAVFGITAILDKIYWGE